MTYRTMIDPLVSVVIPCYNAERWIIETLQSVRDQTWKNIEIIIVNDGSEDRSVELIKSFESSSLILIEQENKGQTAALNAGLAAAKGDYVQYLDADDLLHPDKIEIQIKRIIENPNCIASAEWVRFQESVLVQLLAERLADWAASGSSAQRAAV